MQSSTSDNKLIEPEVSIFQDEITLDSSLSFTYFLEFLKSTGQRHPLHRPFFSYVIKKFEEVPELRGKISDIAILQQHPELLELLEATLFPPADIDSERLFAFSVPWHFKPFHASRKFNEIIYHHIIQSDKAALKRFRCEKAERLFALILSRFYDLDLVMNAEDIYTATDPETKLIKYFQVHYDFRFCTIVAKGPLPSIDKDYIEKNFGLLCEKEELGGMLPLDLFSLEGFTIVYVSEVTESAVVTDLKNILLRMLDNEEEDFLTEAEKAIKSLLGMAGVHVSLLPFPKINNNICKWGAGERKNYLGSLLQHDEAGKRFKEVEDYFVQEPHTLVSSSFSSERVPSFLAELKTTDIKSYLLAPLFRGKELIGVLEIAAYQENLLSKKHVFRLRSTQVLLIQLVANYLQRMDDSVERLIKDQFTSLQPSVEWKFKELAYQYLKEHTSNPGVELGKLVFENVFPVYGAIDIRNSSLKRSEAIQKDLIEHLELIGVLFNELRQQEELPILQELAFKAVQYLDIIQREFTVGSEAMVNSFIETEVNDCLEFMWVSNPDTQAKIQGYREKISPEEGSCCQNRKKYEQSVNMINRKLSQYLEKEQVKLQAFYPHLYEKYRTDGIEYNIYIGQSIQPQRPFHRLHRKNFYLWQLKSMVEMARLTNQLLPHLPLPLQTTQLILLYGNPINIRFRRDERKFDVDDSYNIRYELLKKRIDKISIRDTKERLTQPGKIAVIYSRVKDAEVIGKYLGYLTAEGHLLPGVEELELEEAQGVTGLKALRVQVRME